MNNLSLMIYLSDVIPNLGVFLGVLGGVGMLTTACFFVFSFPWESGDREHVRNRTWNGYGKETTFDYSSSEKIVSYRKLSFKFFFIPLFFVVLAILIPGRQTIQLIAASEASGKIVASQDGQEILGDIKLILKNQIKSYVPKKE